MKYLITLIVFVLIIASIIVIFAYVTTLQNAKVLDIDTKDKIISLYRAPQLKNIDVVVAKFRENISKELLQNIYNLVSGACPNSKINFIIYDKGGLPLHLYAETSEFDIKLVALTNVGREPHTFLHHIVSRYNGDFDLADLTIYLPGSVELSHKWSKFENIVKQIGSSSIVNGTFFDFHFDNPEENVFTSFDFEISEWTSTNTSNKQSSLDQQFVLSPIRPFGSWIQKYFPDQYHQLVVEQAYIPMSYNCVFATGRDTIYKKSISQFKTWLDLAAASGPNGEVLHFFERSTYLMFG